MRIYPHNVLWPTDFSALSLRALPYVRTFCEAFNATLHVIHVAAPLVQTDSTLLRVTASEMLVSMEDTTRPARNALASLVKRRFARIKVAPPEVGNPWREICRYAERERIDLIVIATHGLTRMKHLLMGSTTECVVQHAPCAVFTVRRSPLLVHGQSLKSHIPNRRFPWQPDAFPNFLTATGSNM